MNKIYEDIINEGKKQGAPVEAINAELKAAGANFHLNPDGGIAGWTEQTAAWLGGLRTKCGRASFRLRPSRKT